MARGPNNPTRIIASLTPMVVGVAFALAAVAVLAFFVLPSKGQESGSDLDNSTAINAPDVSQLTEPSATPTIDHTPRVIRVTEPLIIEPSATWTLVPLSETPVPTSTRFVDPVYDTTPRVLRTNTAVTAPTSVPVVDPPIVVPTQPPAQPTAPPLATRPPQDTPTVPLTIAPVVTPATNTAVPPTPVPTRTATQVPDSPTPIPTATFTPEATLPTPTGTVAPVVTEPPAMTPEPSPTLAPVASATVSETSANGTGTASASATGTPTGSATGSVTATRTPGRGTKTPTPSIQPGTPAG